MAAATPRRRRPTRRRRPRAAQGPPRGRHRCSPPLAQLHVRGVDASTGPRSSPAPARAASTCPPTPSSASATGSTPPPGTGDVDLGRARRRRTTRCSARPCRSPTRDGACFTGRLSLDAHPWLADHVVRGTVAAARHRLRRAGVRAGDQVGCDRRGTDPRRRRWCCPSDGARPAPGVRRRRRTTPDARPVQPCTPRPDDDGPTSRGPGTPPGALDRRPAPAAGRRRRPDAPWPPAGADAVETRRALRPASPTRGLGYGPAFQGLRPPGGAATIFAEVALPDEARPTPPSSACTRRCSTPRCTRSASPTRPTTGRARAAVRLDRRAAARDRRAGAAGPAAPPPAPTRVSPRRRRRHRRAGRLRRLAGPAQPSPHGRGRRAAPPRLAVPRGLDVGRAAPRRRPAPVPSWVRTAGRAAAALDERRCAVAAYADLAALARGGRRRGCRARSPWSCRAPVTAVTADTAGSARAVSVDVLEPRCRSGWRRGPARRLPAGGGHAGAVAVRPGDAVGARPWRRRGVGSGALRAVGEPGPVRPGRRRRLRTASGGRLPGGARPRRAAAGGPRRARCAAPRLARAGAPTLALPVRRAGPGSWTSTAGARWRIWPAAGAADAEASAAAGRGRGPGRGARRRASTSATC